MDDDGQPQQLPWEDWRDVDEVAATPRPGCGPPRPSGDAAYEGVVAWSGELGFGVRAPEQGQSAPEPTQPTERRRPDGHDADHDGRAPLMVSSSSSSSARRIVLAGAARASSPVRNPVHAALSLVRHPVRHRRAVRGPGGPLPGRGAGHRLRRRHRRAVPVRDHAARRRPGRGPAGSSRSPASAPLAIVAGLGAPRPARWSSLLASADDRGHRRPGPSPPASTDAAPTSTQLGRVAVHRLPLRLRDHRRCCCHRGGRRRRSLAEAPDAAGQRRIEADGRGRPTSRGEERVIAVAEVTAGLVPGARRRCSSPSAAFGLLVRRNPLVMFMCVELMLNAVNLTFVTFGRACSSDIGGQVVGVLRAGGRRRRGGGRPRPSSWPSSARRPGATADDLSVLKG